MDPSRELNQPTLQEGSEVVSIHQVGGVPKYVAGLEGRVHDIQQMLRQVAIVGFIGMAGIGKTISAKVVFNQISWEFEYTIFVENVKDIPIHTLEHWLLNHFYHQGTKVDPGKIQWSHLQDKRTLIVIDGVDSVEQLSIVGPLSRFGNGSCLIITSRDKEVFKFFENYSLYEISFLRVDEAMTLLCHHVFGLESIPGDLIERNSHLERNVKRVVEKCQGLPLTIEVMGSYLRDHDSQASFWEETIDKLANAQAFAGGPNDHLWGSLRASYDSLSQTEKEMFIDAATVFYEQPLEQALAAWDIAYGDSRVIWENLLNRSMVKELHMRSGETRYVAVWVHEQLRDLALALSSSVSVGSGDVFWQN